MSFLPLLSEGQSQTTLKLFPRASQVNWLRYIEVITPSSAVPTLAIFTEALRSIDGE